VSSFSVPFSLFFCFLPNRCIHARPSLFFFSTLLLFSLSLFLFNKNQNNIFPYLSMHVRFICMDDHDFGGNFFFAFMFRISTHGRSKKRALITYQYVYYLLFLPFFLLYIVTLECSAYTVTYLIIHIFVDRKIFFLWWLTSYKDD
jgi:hypothetical protein